MINLFNLLPVAPLDGGWIVPLFSPRILAVTAVLLLPLTYFNPLICFWRRRVCRASSRAGMQESETQRFLRPKPKRMRPISA
jgi:membrane-associated protease RseP (regulator of RpoE activity)